MKPESIEAVKPWNSHLAYKYYEKVSQKSSYYTDSILYGRITDDKKIESMRIVYRMLKENYSVTNKELIESIRSISKNEFKQLKSVLATLCDFLPIWEEQDNENEKMFWYGMWNREKQYIKELED